jgi:hypothetical protein
VGWFVFLFLLIFFFFFWARLVKVVKLRWLGGLTTQTKSLLLPTTMTTTTITFQDGLVVIESSIAGAGH